MSAAKTAIVWSQPVGGLRLGLSTDNGVADMRLENVGQAPLEVLSYVQAAEIHLDWFSLRIVDAKGQAREIRLLDARNRSARIPAHLPPGAGLDHRVDVASWAKRATNQSQPLAAGHYQISASYQVPAESPYWSGLLQTGQVAIVIP